MKGPTFWSVWRPVWERCRPAVKVLCGVVAFMAFVHGVGSWFAARDQAECREWGELYGLEDARHIDGRCVGKLDGVPHGVDKWHGHLKRLIP